MLRTLIAASALVLMAGCADLREISSHVPSSQNYWVTASPAGNCGVEAISGKAYSAQYCKATQDTADANVKKLNSDLDMYDSIAEQRLREMGANPSPRTGGGGISFTVPDRAHRTAEENAKIDECLVHYQTPQDHYKQELKAFGKAQAEKDRDHWEWSYKQDIDTCEKVSVPISRWNHT